MAGNGVMTEMETFLPSDGSKYKDGLTKKNNISIMKGKHVDRAEWDPFKERKVEHPTTDCDTVTHLLKASLGTGILAMPIAFKHAGMSVGIFATVLVAVICTHCAYILVKCAHKLYYSTRVTVMSFPEVGEVAFANGPRWAKKYARIARISIQAGLFAAYFGTCSVYAVIIASNFREVIEYYSGWDLDLRFYIGGLLLPLIALSWVPNLKMLAPFSMVANLFMGLGLAITVFYYLVWDLGSPSDLPQVGTLKGLPQFFSITIFAMEAIGVVMPLENSMKTPEHFIGLCGVLNKGMSGVTLIYILVGFLGYLKYGEKTQDNITNSLEIGDIAAQAVNILVGLAVFCTYGLQYFVCLEIVWDGLKERYQKNARTAEYIVRTALTFISVMLAVAVPNIGPFMGLIGSLCFAWLGLIIPVFIETVTYWDIGFGPCNWVAYKNVLVLLFGVIALVFGTLTSIEGIIAAYVSDITTTVTDCDDKLMSCNNDTSLFNLSPTEEISNFTITNS